MAMKDETTARGKSVPQDDKEEDTRNEQAIGSCTHINTTTDWYLKGSKYPRQVGNNFTPYMGGETLFAAIADSIEKAQSSVDIVTMGFDPAMPMRRPLDDKEYSETVVEEKRHFLFWKKPHRYSPWSKKDAYGEIMLKALEKNERLKIRLLLWKHMSGFIHVSTGLSPTLASEGINYKSSRETGFDIRDMGSTNKERKKNLALRARNPEAASYSAQWFYKVCWEDFVGADRMGVVFRHMPTVTPKEEEALVGAEGVTFKFPSHHQKVVIIDYDDPQKRHAYIIGLNSQTNYWSAFPFEHRDVRSEMDWCPYHDFGIRVEGPLVADLNENFYKDWDINYRSNHLSSALVRHKGAHSLDQSPPISPKRQIYNEPPLTPERKAKDDANKDYPHKAGAAKGQIVRTRPDHALETGNFEEKEIKDAYLQAAREIRQYMLIVNQYCQYPKLFTHLKHWRYEYTKGQKKHYGEVSRVFILMGTCKPERPGMVFRSHQMANELGVGNQFPTADKTLYEEDTSAAKPEENTSNTPTDSDSDELELEQDLGSANALLPEDGMLDLKAELNMPSSYDPLDYAQEDEGSAEEPAAESTEGAENTEEPIPEDVSKTEEFQLENPEETIPSGSKTTWRGKHTFKANDKVTLEQVQNQGIYPLFFTFYTQIPKTPRVDENDKPLLIDTIAQQVYVHGKLMVEDDAFFTLGSANLNIRSLAVDSELNLISDDCATARKFRKEILDAYTGIDASIDDNGKRFPNYDDHLDDEQWNKIYNELVDLTQKNSDSIFKRKRIQGHIAWFDDDRKITGLTNVRIG